MFVVFANRKYLAFFKRSCESPKTEFTQDSLHHPKIKNIFRILNDFIDTIREEYKNDFQIIMFEHIPKEIWEEEKLSSFWIVAEFDSANGLMDLS